MAQVPKDALLAAILVLSCGVSFGLGMLTEREGGKGTGFSIEYPAGALGAAVGAAGAPVATPEGAQYVASKNGTKYHALWCSGAKTISEANKIWFSTKEEAEARGYTPAANCKGI